MFVRTSARSTNGDPQCIVRFTRTGIPCGRKCSISLISMSCLGSRGRHLITGLKTRPPRSRGSATRGPDSVLSLPSQVLSATVASQNVVGQPCVPRYRKAVSRGPDRPLEPTHSEPLQKATQSQPQRRWNMRQSGGIVFKTFAESVRNR